METEIKPNDQMYVSVSVPAVSAVFCVAFLHAFRASTCLFPPPPLHLRIGLAGLECAQGGSAATSIRQPSGPSSTASCVIENGIPAGIDAALDAGLDGKSNTGVGIFVPPDGCAPVAQRGLLLGAAGVLPPELWELCMRSAAGAAAQRMFSQNEHEEIASDATQPSTPTPVGAMHAVRTLASPRPFLWSNILSAPVCIRTIRYEYPIASLCDLLRW
jgi:hypothetical protein